MFKMIKMTGNSLSPEYQAGDYVLISAIPVFFNLLRKGDTVVFLHMQHGTLIKRVDRISSPGDTIHVIGNHPTSIDSRQFGPIKKDTLLGKVIWHIPKRGQRQIQDLS